MIKVGIECESTENDSWGVARMTSKLLEEIAKRPELSKEFEFFLYFKSRVPDLPFLSNPIFTKKVLQLPGVPLSFSFYYYVYVPIYAWFTRPDVLFYPNYMLPLIHLGKSAVMLTEDIHAEMRNPKLPFRYRLAYMIFGNWAARRATRVVAISETSKSELKRLFGIAPERIFTNPLGVDVPLRLQSRKLNYILYVGQAFERRHLRETMLAFEKIAPKFPGLKLVAVGADKYQPPVVGKLAKEINGRLGGERVIHKDRVPQAKLDALYDGALALTYVSDKEAFGLPPLEALAHGTIPVVADAAVSREIFGTNAFMIRDPNNIDEFARILEQALTDTQKKESVLNGRGAILQKYTWRLHTDRFIRMVKEICSKN